MLHSFSDVQLHRHANSAPTADLPRYDWWADRTVSRAIFINHYSKWWTRLAPLNCSVAVYIFHKVFSILCILTTRNMTAWHQCLFLSFVPFASRIAADLIIALALALTCDLKTPNHVISRISKFEHYGIWRFWVMLWTNRQTDGLEHPTHAVQTIIIITLDNVYDAAVWQAAATLKQANCINTLSNNDYM